MSHNRLFLFSDLANARIWDASERYDHQPTVEISGRIAYTMAPYFVPYMRLGIGTSRDKLISTFTGTPTVNTQTVEIVSRRQVYHWVAGFGAEVPFCFLNIMPLSFRLEYNTHVPGTALNTDVTMEDGIINPEFLTITKPKRQVIKAQLVWNLL